MLRMTAKARRPVLVTLGSDASAESPPTADRDPVHVLYEQAAGLLASSGALRAAAHTPGIAAALGPTLACLEASLDALAGVADELGKQAVQSDSEAGATGFGARRTESEIARRFQHLADALEESRVASGYARVAMGPVESCARHTLSQQFPSDPRPDATDGSALRATFSDG